MCTHVCAVHGHQSHALQAWWVSTYYAGVSATLWTEGQPRSDGLAAIQALENTAAMSRMAGYFAEVDIHLVVEVRGGRGRGGAGPSG